MSRDQTDQHQHRPVSNSYQYHNMNVHNLTSQQIQTLKTLCLDGMSFLDPSLKPQTNSST